MDDTMESFQQNIRVINRWSHYVYRKENQNVTECLREMSFHASVTWFAWNFSYSVNNYCKKNNNKEMLCIIALTCSR
jgi:hypothetical protein